MANTFINVKEIARRSLERLQENLVFPELIYRDYSSDFVNGKGETIQIRKPVVLNANDFTSTVAAQDIEERSIDVKLDTLSDVTVEYTAVQEAVNMGDAALERQFIEPAAAALAEHINAKGLALALDVPYVCGTAGTTPDSLAAFAEAAKVLDENKAPTTLRRGVWNPAAMAKFRQIGDIVNANKSGTTEALRAGSIGNIFGIDNYMAQGVKSFTSGVTEASAVKPSAGASAGATTISLTGTTLAGKLVKGDVLTILGSNYVVTEDTAAAASNAIANVKIYPALSRAITTATNVTINASHTANMVFHQNAFAFVTRPLATPAGAESYVVNGDGLSLRVVRQYDIATKKDMFSMDILYGYKTIYPELAVRVMG